jgi:hypothetical protein
VRLQSKEIGAVGKREAQTPEQLKESAIECLKIASVKHVGLKVEDCIKCLKSNCKNK